MKVMKKTVLGLLACIGQLSARPSGFRTANSQAEDIKALQETVAAQQEEITSLRAAAAVPPAPAQATLGSTDLLIKGAGVDAEDVNWRIRAGLSPQQAVEVAMAEKVERENAATNKGEKN